MAVKAKVISGKGGWQGAATSLTGYTITEDSTPLDPADSSGSTGSISFGVSEDKNANGTIALLGATLNLSDSDNGQISGLVRTLNTINGETTVQLESSLSLLNADRLVNGYSGTLRGAFTYYFSLVGIGTPGFTVADDIALRTVAFQGWTGKIWDGLKEICAAQGIEISYVSNKIVVRSPRGREAVHYRDSSVEFSISNNEETALAIEIYAYHNEYKSFAVVYPPVRGEASPISVDAGEIKVITAEINASIIALVQPEALATINPMYSQVSGYVVVDKDGKTVAPGIWAGAGGKVRVGMGESPDEIMITVTGASLANGPFQLGIKQDDDTISTLLVGGEAIISNPEKLTIATGADPAIVTQKVGITVDNPQISTLAEAYAAGLRAASAYGGVSRALKISTARINRVGESGSASFYTFDEFAAEYNPTTFTQWEASVQWNGKTFANFEEFYAAVHANDFSNQAFGNVGGARVRYRDAWYRIRTSQINPLGLQYTAEPDTLVADFEINFAGEDGSGMTFVEYETMMAGKTFDDQAASPLWRTYSSEITEGYGSSPYGSGSYGY